MKIDKSFKLIALVLCLFSLAQAQNPQPTKSPDVIAEVTTTAKLANSDPLYQKIRQNLNIKTVSGDVAIVTNFAWQKDRATFNLKSGEIYFLAPVEGRVTAAVFIGDGELSLTPPVEVEKKHLAIFTGAPEIKEQFSQLVMYFTDKSYEEVKNSPNVKMTTSGSQAASASDALREKGDMLKRRFRLNMSERMLSDFLTPQRPGFFTTFIEGKKFGKLMYQIDPLGAANVYPEQVSLTSYGTTDGGIWTAFHMADEYKKGTANSWTDRRTYDIVNHDIDVNVQGTKLISKDVITLQALEPDIRFVPFDLYQSLRVKTVRDESGNEISFIQEKKDEDADFGVLFDKPLEKGKPVKISVEYEGDGALSKEGSGNFYLGPRSTWYPNNPFTSFGDRATFNLTFKYPKKYVMVGVGNRVGEDTVEGDSKISHWTTDGIEYEVAGFNYGDFKMNKVMDASSGYEIEVYANNELPDSIKDYQKQIEEAQNRGAVTFNNVSTLNTLEGIGNVLVDTQNSMRIYNDYFGKLPYKRIAITQQPAGNFGQAWTTLVFMPYIAYIPQAQRVQIFGIKGGTDEFWSQVGPHEVAHQWWGHIVGWTSYHDQWMSEGFADMSSSLFVQFIEKNQDKFTNYWESQRKLITEASPATKGLKPYTVGPVTQGYRLNSGKTGSIARQMIYPKGAYILHMLRMMMYDHRGKVGDARFSAMMKDFIKANYNKPVSTEDFKKAVERNMTPEMDIDQNKKMNWFFDEWVYGTEMPSYKLNYQVGSKDGKSLLTVKLTQSGVSQNFVMMVPLYADFGSGWKYLTSVTMAGNDTLDFNIPLSAAPKKVAVAALNDVLAENIDISK